MNFNQLYTAYSPKIYRVCLGYLNDIDLAKDIMQETFITAWENLQMFRGDAKIETWIYRIATNKCLRQLQYEKRERTADLPFHIPDEHQEVYKEDDRVLLLRQCIAELKEIDRLIISLYLEELSQQKIADIVGMSHENVRIRVHRIKEKLGKKIKANGKF
ncbi:RNA polymerase sigma factor [Zhouia sp. PK063]|uniref:RNA polymerase sigma factor n=1 Tax=Zhouia sp. PK063 TaxID=3373602 RepID=UPI003794C332